MIIARNLTKDRGKFNRTVCDDRVAPWLADPFMTVSVRMDRLVHTQRRQPTACAVMLLYDRRLGIGR